MGTFLAIALLGFVLGMRHATDSDHVVAVSTIVSQQRRLSLASLIGVLWGIGHSITILLVGTAIIIFNVVIPPHVGLSMEFAVAIMLVVLGVLNLSGVMRWVTENLTPGARSRADHWHFHAHDSDVHAHVHSHGPAPALEARVNAPFRLLERLGWYQLIRPLAVGLVHGLAGSAAVALLVLTTINDPYWAVFYLVIFGIGTLVGMMLITSAIGYSFIFTANRFGNLGRYIGVASGVMSIVLGVYLMYQIGIVEGLFTGSPNWSPE